jgi:hypothetical protein
MAGIGNDERTARRYKWTLATITELLTVTHAIFIDYLDRLAESKTVSEAEEIMKEISEGVLEESFRAEGLCDAFEGLGEALAGVNYRTREDLSQAGKVTSLSSSDVDESQGIASILANRENEVARLYVEEIQELRDTVRKQIEIGGSLEPILARADAARGVLTEQLANFQRLASEYRR